MDKNRGFVQIIIIILLLVVILSLLGVSLSSLFSNPVLKENFGFLGDWFSNFWDNYFAGSFWYLWNIWLEAVWEPFLKVLGR